MLENTCKVQKNFPYIFFPLDPFFRPERSSDVHPCMLQWPIKRASAQCENIAIKYQESSPKFRHST